MTEIQCINKCGNLSNEGSDYCEDCDLNYCERCGCVVDRDTFELYGNNCEGCGIWLNNAEIAKYGAPEWDNYNDRSAELND